MFCNTRFKEFIKEKASDKNLVVKKATTNIRKDKPQGRTISLARTQLIDLQHKTSIYYSSAEVYTYPCVKSILLPCNSVYFCIVKVYTIA